MISINSLTKKFNKGKNNEIEALRGVNVELGDRGLVAIFGKSGSGKTTLMNMIGGLDKFDEGSIEIDGNKFTRLVDDRFRVDNIGYIFQNYCLDPSINVYENVAMGLRTIGIKDEELIFNRCMTALANVNMEEYYRRDVTALSGGQQQRVAIARVMAKGARIILADEPTGNLDEYNTILVMDILKEISKESLVILVTHEGDLVERYADKVITIGDGELESENRGAYTGDSTSNTNHIFLGDMAKRSERVCGVDFEFYGDSVPCKIQIVGIDGKYYLATDTTKVNYIDDNSEVQLVEGTREDYEKRERERRSVSMRSLGRVEPGDNKRVFDFGKAFVDGFHANFGKGAGVKGRVLTTAVMLLTVAIVLVACFLGGAIYNYNNPNGILPGGVVLADIKSDNGEKVFQYAREKNLESVFMPYFATIRIDVEPFESSNIELKADNYIMYRDKARSRGKKILAGNITDNMQGIVVTDTLVKMLYQYTYIEFDGDYERIIGSLVRDLDQHYDMRKVGYIEAVVHDDGIAVYAMPAIVAGVSLANAFGLEIAEMHEGTYADDVVYLTEDSPYYDYYNADEGVIWYKSGGEDKKFKAEILPSAMFSKTIMLTYNTYLKAESTLIKGNNGAIKAYVFTDDTRAVATDMIDKLSLPSNRIILRERQLEYWHEREGDSITVNVIVFVVLFGLMVALLGLLMFSSFASKVKEVGIYRAIGVSKGNIVSKVFAENLATVVIAVVTALLLIGLPITILTAGAPIMNMCLEWWLFATIFVLLVGASAVMSVLPVMSLLRKTPREILSKYDI